MEAEPHRAECTGDAGALAWLGSGAAPQSDWWQGFARRRPFRVKPLTHGGWVPTVELRIFGLDSTSSVLRMHWSWLGQYKQCYREALAKSLEHPANGRPLQGDWVARFVQRSDRICSVRVLETTLPSELSDCLRGRALQQPRAGEDGQLEILLTFRVQ